MCISLPAAKSVAVEWESLVLTHTPRSSNSFLKPLAWNGERCGSSQRSGRLVSQTDPWIQAPGEAEAELAHLNQLGHVDGIMSDDCDSLVFGAKVLLKKYDLPF